MLFALPVYPPTNIADDEVPALLPPLDVPYLTLVNQVVPFHSSVSLFVLGPNTSPEVCTPAP